LDLVSIVSKKDTELTISFKQFKQTCITKSSTDIINTIRAAYYTCFPSIQEGAGFKVDVSPPSRYQSTCCAFVPVVIERPLSCLCGVQLSLFVCEISVVSQRCLTHTCVCVCVCIMAPFPTTYTSLQDLPNKEGECGGYATTYKSLCDYHSIVPRVDIIWDVNTILPANNVKEFDLKEFEQPIRTQDIATLIRALGFNKYFLSVSARRYRLDKDAFVALGEALAMNCTLERLNLNYAGGSKDTTVPVAEGLKANKFNSISAIDIAGNSISDKGLTAWGQAIGAMGHGLQSLDLSDNGASKTGTAGFFNGMRKNVFMAASLNSLNTSGNRLESDGSTALSAFLANPNQLHVLNLANCQANLGSILGAITRGSPELHYLDLSGNKIGRKEIGQLKLFLQGSSSLKGLSLANTSLTVDLLKEVCNAVFTNPYLQDFSLDISNNKLGPAGAKLLAGFAATMKNVGSLLVADNDFGDEGVCFLADGLQKNECLKSLSIGGNFTSGGGPKRDATVESLVELIASECPITSLSLDGNPRNSLKQDVVHFLYSLGTNDTLINLDLSNVGMSDRGAMALGKALQTNRSLKSVSIDGNGIHLAGFQSLKHGLDRNHTLKQMSIPLLDVADALRDKNDGKLVQQVVGEIEDAMRRNASPKSKFDQSSGSTGGGAMSGQLKILSSGERELIERLRFKIKSSGKVLDEEGERAMEDAHNNDAYISQIHNFQQEAQIGAQLAIKNKLGEFVSALAPVIDEYYRSMLDKVMKLVNTQYLSIDEETARRLHRNIMFGAKEVDEEAVRKVLVDATGEEIANRANEQFVSAVEIASDYIYEKLGENLQNIVNDVRRVESDAEESEAEYSEEEEDEEEEEEEEEEEVEEEEEAEEEEDQQEEEPSEPVAPSTPPPAGLPPPIASGTPPPIGLPPPISVSSPGAPPPRDDGAEDSPSRPARPPPRPVRPATTYSGAPPPGAFDNVEFVGRPGRGGPGTPGRGAPPRPTRPGAARGSPGGQSLAERRGFKPPVGFGMMGGAPMPMPGMARGSPGPPAVAPRAAVPSPGGPPAGLGPAPAPPVKPAGVKTPTKAPAAAATKKAPAKKAAAPKKRGLFARKKGGDAKPSSRRGKAKGRAAPAAAKKEGITANVAAPSGESANLDRMPTKQSNIREHVTRDRPMVQRKRRPPTRRPRANV